MSTTTIDLVRCDRCDRCAGEATGTWSTEDGQEICLDCAEQYYTECARCGDYVESTLTTDEDQQICRYCADHHYTRCDSCDRYSEYTETATDGCDVCEPCVESAYWRCDGCGDLIDFGHYCESCADDYANAGLVHDYDYKPAPSLHGDGPLYLGAELEINVPYQQMGDCAEFALSYLGSLGYLKEDGSIDHGFEIVTHPMSYEWAMRHFPWDMLNGLRKIGCNATGNGLHVHVSRAAFDSACHVFRWMKFLYRNARQVTTIARRVSDHWAPFDSYARRHVKSYAKGAKSRRYQAINTQNDHTFELRVFASSLEPHEVKAALGLATASVEYTRNLSVSAIARNNG